MSIEAPRKAPARPEYLSQVAAPTGRKFVIQVERIVGAGRGVLFDRREVVLARYQYFPESCMPYCSYSGTVKLTTVIIILYNEQAEICQTFTRRRSVMGQLLLPTTPLEPLPSPHIILPSLTHPPYPITHHRNTGYLSCTYIIST